MKIIVAALMFISLGLNAFLWKVASDQRRELAALQATATEAEELRRQNQELQASRAAAPSPATEADVKDLARLRNEVSQLRKTAAEVNALRAQAAEAAQLRQQLAAAAQGLAQKDKEIADAQKVAPEQAEQAKQRAQVIGCINNLKQIGLAARIYANANGQTFPPDFLTIRNELTSPRFLFCPASPSGVQATDWTQFNPATISYQYLNPNGTTADPQKPLVTCPIHGHMALSDGSVQMGRR
jgi:hypothetical protein